MFTVNIVVFGRPQEEQYEIIGSTKECDEQDNDHGPLRFCEHSSRDHWIRSELDFPDKERNDQGNTDEERHKHMNTCPLVLDQS